MARDRHADVQARDECFGRDAALRSGKGSVRAEESRGGALGQRLENRSPGENETVGGRHGGSLPAGFADGRGDLFERAGGKGARMTGKARFVTAGPRRRGSPSKLGKTYDSTRIIIRNRSSGS